MAIILAAGISSRMNTQLPKVLHKVCGRPILSYVLEACRQVGIKKIYVVVGYGAEKVKAEFDGANDIVWVTQGEQKGTAHAVLCCKQYIEDFDGQTLVLCGDGPLIRAEILEKLMKEHGSKTAVTMATAVLDDPTGYGRVLRDASGNIRGIVEHNDCTSEQLAVREVNPSYYLFDNKTLFKVLGRVKADNAKKEYYLTDAVSIIITDGLKVSAVTAVRPEEAMSVNTPEQLHRVNEIMCQRLKQGAKAKIEKSKNQ